MPTEVIATPRAEQQIAGLLDGLLVAHAVGHGIDLFATAGPRTG